MRCQPASLRLTDNDQLKAGYAFRTAKGPIGFLIDGLKMLYITYFKGIDMDKICYAIIIMEGNHKEVAMQEENLNTIGLASQGIPAGETLGRRGYQLTFVIAYIRVCIRTSNLKKINLWTSSPRLGKIWLTV